MRIKKLVTWGYFEAFLQRSKMLLYAGLVSAAVRSKMNLRPFFRNFEREFIQLWKPQQPFAMVSSTHRLDVSQMNPHFRSRVTDRLGCLKAFQLWILFSGKSKLLKHKSSWLELLTWYSLTNRIYQDTNINWQSPQSNRFERSKPIIVATHGWSASYDDRSFMNIARDNFKNHRVSLLHFKAF